MKMIGYFLILRSFIACLDFKRIFTRRFRRPAHSIARTAGGERHYADSLAAQIQVQTSGKLTLVQLAPASDAAAEDVGIGIVVAVVAAAVAVDVAVVEVVVPAFAADVADVAECG
jgi:hypothetical protein